MTKKQFAMRCVYCGGFGVTKEHYWGKWSKKHAQGNANRTAHIIRRPLNPFDPLSPTVETAGALKRQGGPRSKTLKIACEQCNNGWMKKAVDNAIPLLIGLSNGVWPVLCEADRRRLATWATMFTMSAEFADRETAFISENERRRFAEAGVPSPNWSIAIGQISVTPGLDPYFHRALILSSLIPWKGHRQMQITTFGFGRLLVQTFYSECPLRFDFAAYARRRGLHPLWPLTADPISKPAAVHNRHSFFALVGELTDLLGGAEGPEIT